MNQATKIINIGNLELGDNKPERIIVPITAKTYKDVLVQANRLITEPVDIIEWRLDYLQSNLSDFDTLIGTAIDLKSILGETPIIATNRTVKEGGDFDYSGNLYTDTYNQLIQAEIIDAIDVEFSREDIEIAQLRSLTTNGDVTMIMSHHDFEKSPDKNELIFLMSQMAKGNPDIIEVAIAATNREDVMNLMDATLAADHQIQQPLITLSIGELGKITQLAGKTFGRIATYGPIENNPNQLSVSMLKDVLANV